MPKAAKQLSSILQLFRISPGNYSLRLSDSKENYIAVKLAELIPDLTSLQVITPSDMRVFYFGEDLVSNGTKDTHYVPPNGHDVDPLINDDNSPDPMDTAMELADQENPLPPMKAKPKRGRPTDLERAARKSSAERQDKCLRCSGAGQVQQLMEGGASATTACPVCQGEGIINRFGAQR